MRRFNYVGIPQSDVACGRIALEQANKQLAHLSQTDNLTGLLNRGAWEKQLHNEFERFARYGGTQSLIMLDIDNFKAVNDQYGHPVGDDVIRHLAKCIRSSLRHTDHPGRYGGEEFAIILPETELEGAKVIAERLRQCIESAVVHSHNLTLNYTVSLGVAPLTAETSDVDAWLRSADNALYAAKHAGKNQVMGAKQNKAAFTL